MISTGSPPDQEACFVVFLLLFASIAPGRKFGAAMSHALAACLAKGLKATSGKKLPDAVKTVCLAFSDVRLAPLQAGLRGDDDAEASQTAPVGRKRTSSSFAPSPREASPEQVVGRSLPPSSSGGPLCDAAAIAELYGMPAPASPAKKRSAPAPVVDLLSPSPKAKKRLAEKSSTSRFNASAQRL